MIPTRTTPYIHTRVHIFDGHFAPKRYHNQGLSSFHQLELLLSFDCIILVPFSHAPLNKAGLIKEELGAKPLPLHTQRSQDPPKQFLGTKRRERTQQRIMSEPTWSESEIKARLAEFEELFYEALGATDSFYENGCSDVTLIVFK